MFFRHQHTYSYTHNFISKLIGRDPLFISIRVSLVDRCDTTHWHMEQTCLIMTSVLSFLAQELPVELVRTKQTNKYLFFYKTSSFDQRGA